MFYGEKKDVKKSCGIDKKEWADQVFAEEEKHEKPGQGVKAQNKFENRDKIKGDGITFIFPTVFFAVYAIFGRTDKTAFHAKKRFKNRLGVIDGDSGAQTH